LHRRVDRLKLRLHSPLIYLGLRHNRFASILSSREGLAPLRSF
jgi:hypothetical protein